MGNLQSVQNALLALGHNAEISSDPEVLSSADAYILPGVGAFPKAMENLAKLNLIKVLEKNVIQGKKPLLGICLGMQLIAKSSEELGHHEGLGWLDAKVVAIPSNLGMKVPHVGWNDLKIQNPNSIFNNIDSGSNFYFDHSFHFTCEDKFVTATCNYGMPVIAAVQKDNIFAVQFHPEKSQTAGLRFLRNFSDWVLKC